AGRRLVRRFGGGGRLVFSIGPPPGHQGEDAAPGKGPDGGPAPDRGEGQAGEGAHPWPGHNAEDAEGGLLERGAARVAAPWRLGATYGPATDSAGTSEAHASTCDSVSPCRCPSAMPTNALAADTPAVITTAQVPLRSCPHSSALGTHGSGGGCSAGSGGGSSN